MAQSHIQGLVNKSKLNLGSINAFGKLMCTVGSGSEYREDPTNFKHV